MANATKSERLASPLQWRDGRWHCGRDGIHAGERLELLGSDGEWFGVRIESSDGGRKLTAYFNVHGLIFVRAMDTVHDRLRWPQT